MRPASSRIRRWVSAALPLLAVTSIHGTALAQQGAQDAAPQKVLSLQDYGRWNRITSTALSGDGRWMSYAYAPNDGDATLFLRQIDAARVDTVPRGTGATFSKDGKWVLYSVTAPQRTGGQRGAAQGGQRGQAPQRGQTPPQTPPPQGRGGRGGAAGPRTQVLRDLETRATFEVQDIANASFSPDGRFALFKRSRAEGVAHEGTDLLIRTLANGQTLPLGNVAAFSFNETGKLLAYTVDAADNVGNGVFVYHVDTGLVDALDTERQEYAQLSWNEQGTALAVLRGEKKSGNVQRDNVLLVFSGLGAKESVRETVFDPVKATGFPQGMVVSEFTGLSWSDNGQRVYLAIKEQTSEPPESSDPRANVDVWHWKDEDVQSVQMVRRNQAERATHAAVYHLDTGKFVRLADDELTGVTRTVEGNGRYAIGRLDKPYRYEITWGGSRGDFYRVDVTTGERTLMVAGIGRAYGASPDGRWWVYLQNQTLFAREIETGKTVNLSQIAGVSFIDHRDDHPYELPIYGVAGWTKDNKAILLYDDFDVWSVPLYGGKAANITGGVGNAEQLRFRIVRLFDAQEEGGGGRGGGGGGGGGGGNNAVDLSKPIYLSATGEWTKKSGYYELKPGGKPTPIVLEDATIGGVSKAENADRIIFTKQTFVEFPDFWVSDTRFRSPRRLTDANPQQANFAWGRRILIDYTNSKGQKLQATLALPANFEPGKRYPMLVYFYEIMSNQHHRYSMPAYDDRPHMSTYASDGYLVLQPDVVYEAGKPGTSAVDCVTAAVKKVIELGYADPARIGLQGHSWGGYQSSYIVTQTDLFAAVVTGAPVTNLTSFYNELYKSSGNVQQGIVERGQVRMGTTPYENYDLFKSQSPVHRPRTSKRPSSSCTARTTAPSTGTRGSNTSTPHAGSARR
jgi:dipeptidyl aminopeptidase/acylaminoacyl peptidase